MPKTRANKSNKGKELEKAFLKQLKTIEQNERKQKGKKVSNSKQGKGKPNATAGRKDGSKKAGGRIPKPNKLDKKIIQQPAKQSKTVKGSKGKRRTKQKAKSTRTTGSVVISPRKRGKQDIEISFKGVRSIHKKVSLINESDNISKSIKLQLRRKGGKPAKGIIIIVRDKKGNEAAHVSIPSFVVNEANVKTELEKFTKDLKEEYSQRQQDLADGEPMDESAGYEDYNPDNIQSIDIKFIY